GELPDDAIAEDAGVVHEDVDATGFRDHLVHRGGDLASVRDVGDQADRADLLRRARDRLGVDIDEVDGRAGIPEAGRDGPADATRRPGDHDGPAAEVEAEVSHRHALRAAGPMTLGGQDSRWPRSPRAAPRRAAGL